MFPALAPRIAVNIVGPVSFFRKFIHRPLYGGRDFCFPAGDLCHTHFPDDPAVKSFFFFFHVLCIMDHVAGNLKLMA